MEAISKPRLEIEQNETTRISPTCLHIPLILRKVLEHCSNRDLIELSLVNKQWNYEARSIIKKRSCTLASLKTGQPCRKLAQFVYDVGQMSIVPFCGMSLEVSDRDVFDHFLVHHAMPKWDPTWDVALDRLEWKHLQLCFRQHWLLFNSCPALILMKTILGNFSGTLQGLSIKLSHNKLAAFSQEIFQDSIFPRLKSLRLKVFHRPSATVTHAERMFIKTLLARAPNLEELFLDQQFTLKENVLEGSSAVLAVEYEIDPMDAGICEELIGFVRLDRMQLKYQEKNFNMERFDRIVLVLLRTSRTALKSLRLNITFLPHLMRYGICLVNVTELRIDMNCRQLASFESSMLRLVNAFDFTQMFPRLDNVWIEPCPRTTASHSKMRKIMELGNSIEVAPNFGHTARIKHLRLCLPIIPPVFAAIFPNIEVITVTTKRWPAFPYGLIWEHWPQLKELQVHVQGYDLSGEQTSWAENFDSLFCGIFPEEIAELRDKDEQYLKNVKIVPIMPSITCLKVLTTFRLVIWGSGRYIGESEPLTSFSKVTAFIAFSRCSNLSVHIESKI